MLSEHFPKLSLSLGVVIVICFFLPWVSIDCGNVTFIKFSGYDLTAGRLPIDKGALEQLTNQMGQEQNLNLLEQDQHSKPQWYLALVIVCALGICVYSIKMFSGTEKIGLVAIILFSIFGLLILVIAALLDFGMDIPADAAMFIQTSFQIGLYLITLFYIAAIALAYFALRDLTVQNEEIVAPVLDVPIENIPNTSAQTIEEPIFGEKLEKIDTINFGINEKKPIAPSKPRPAPHGAKTCPLCGVVVSQYQSKCIKCGANIKLGK